MFDFSNFPKDLKFYDSQNEMIVGKMKVLLFVGLKSKMYWMLSDDGKESSTSKGVDVATKFNQFRDTLFNKKVLRYKMKRIQRKKQKLGTYEISKISSWCFDGKRFALNVGIHTLAYFHKGLRKQILTGDHKKKRFKKILTN